MSQQGHVGTVCGTTEQWADLKVTTGFRCVTIIRSRATREELCATAREWGSISRRNALTAATADTTISGMGSSGGS
jgi:hypothetical protein